MATISKSEKSYILSGILSDPPSRADGRAKDAFRTISLQTGVAPLANGSARVSIGRDAHDRSGGTEVMVGCKLEVGNVGEDDGMGEGRVLCSVICSPAAYPTLTSSALDELQYDYTTVLSTTLSHPSLRPKNLTIVPGKKAWTLNVDVVVLADAGNAYDAIFMACRAALWDTKVPRTRSVEAKVEGYEPGGKKSAERGDMDVDADPFAMSALNMRKQTSAADFELPDYWDEGEDLDGRDRWPVCVTLNIASNTHFLDATTFEEASVSSKLQMVFSFPSSSPSSGKSKVTGSRLHGIRTLGAGEFSSTQIEGLLKDGEKYAGEIWKALDIKLQEQAAGEVMARKKF